MIPRWTKTIVFVIPMPTRLVWERSDGATLTFIGPTPPHDGNTWTY